jgi:UDP-N-acetylmuramoyl-L-alanyl-D-glutamate--2,6-diaminopimelate ligase
LNTLNNNTKVFVNIDDKYGKNFAETAKIKGFSVETIGFMESADIRIKIFKNSINTNAIEFGQKTRKKISHTNLFGEFQAVNLGLAALACNGFGLSLNEIIDLIPNIKPINGRMEFVGETKSGSQVFIDFAHSPDAMEKLLRVFKKETPAKLILVFGAGGERDKDKRKYMGLVASKLADKVYVTDDNPRNENPALIRKDLIDWCPEAIEVSDRAEAIFRAIKESELGDIVIIAGKGHENVQIIGSQQFPFNDFENASIAIATIKNTEI